MKSIKKISDILAGITSGQKNKSSGTYLNSAGSSFFLLDGEITVPRISVKNLDYDTALPILLETANFIPEYLCSHSLLENRNPPSDEHQIHLTKRIPGRVIDFVHMLRLDLKFAGNVLKIIQKADTDFYPAYITDKIFFRSQLIPVLKNSPYGSIEQIRLIDSRHMESDQHFHTFAIFDDIKEKDISKELSKIPGASLFRISVELYQFITYGYFTSCLNIPDPTQEEISTATEIFEPLFIYIYSKYKNLPDIADKSLLADTFSESLAFNDQLLLNDDFLSRLGNYFGRFSLFADDKLMLEGWRKFIIS